MAKAPKKIPVSMPTASAKPSSVKIWQHKYFFEAAIFLFSVLLFSNSILNGYNLDDELVTINHRLTSKGLSAIPEIFTSPYYQDESGYSYEYRPVVLASFAIEHEFFGDSAHVNHFINMVLYGLTCIILFWVLSMIFKTYSHWISFAIALLFVAHPAHTEVVCSIKNRDEILGFLFGLLAFWMALKAVMLPRKWLLVLVPVFFMLSLMSKNTMIAFVIIIPIGIILFTEAKFFNVIVTTILLLIPGFFLLNLSSGYGKVLLLSEVVVAIFSLYILIHFGEVINGLKNLPSKIKKTLIDPKAKEVASDNRSTVDIKINKMPKPWSYFVILAGIFIFYCWQMSNKYFIQGIINPEKLLAFEVDFVVVVMILFEVNLPSVLLLGLLLYSPAFLFASMSTVSSRVAIGGGIEISILIGYYIINFSRRYLKLRVNTYKALIPDPILFSLSTFSVFSILSITYCLCVYWKHLSFALPILFLFVALVFLGNRRMVFWATIMLNFCLVFNITMITGREQLYIYITLIEFLFLWQLFLGTQDSLATALMSLFMTYTIGADLANSDLTPPILYVLPFLIIGRKTFSLTVLFILFLSNIIFITFFHHTGSGAIRLFNLLDYLPSILLVITISLTFLPFIAKYFGRVFLLIIIVVFGVINWPSEKPIGYFSGSNQTKATLNKLNVVVVSTNQNRPLSYVEDCIEPNSPFSTRFGTSLEILNHYLIKVICPYPLSFYYGYKYIVPKKATDISSILSLLLYLLILIVALLFSKRDPIISFGLLVYLVSIVSFSNYFVPVAGMITDRFLLIPSLGWLIVLVRALWLAAKLDNKKSIEWNTIKLVPKYTFLIILLMYSTLTFSRNMDWKDYLTLFRKDIKYVNESAQAHNLLALRLIKNSYDLSDPAEQLVYRHEAIYHFKRAVEIYPLFFNPTYDLGRAYSIVNQPDSSIYFYKKAIELDSTFTPAITSVGELLLQQNRFSEAEGYFEKIIRLQPGNYWGYDKVGMVFFLQKDYYSALNIMVQARREMPKNPNPYIKIGRIYHALEKDDSTGIWIKKALEVDPDNQEAKQFLQSISK